MLRIIFVDIALRDLQTPAVGRALAEHRIGHTVVRLTGDGIDGEGRHHPQVALLVLPVEPLFAKGLIRTHRIGDGQHRLYVIRYIEGRMVLDALHGGAVDTQGVLQQHLSGTRT